jgi:hypothetical protein
MEVKCANCNREIVVKKRYIREIMFCTLECMDSYKTPGSGSIKKSGYGNIYHVFEISKPDASDMSINSI